MEELEGWTSIAVHEAWLDPGASTESACLALELDPPDEDVGRARSPLLHCLGEWRDLGELWRLSDPWLHLFRSLLRDQWCSDPLVPEGTGLPSDLELPTTETLDDRVFLSPDLEGQSAESASIALDANEVAESALFVKSSFLDDPSSLCLTGGTWSPSSGAWISIEPSISWLFFAALAAAATLRFCFSWTAFSNTCHASGIQSLHTSREAFCVQRVKPSLRRHCWHRK